VAEQELIQIDSVKGKIVKHQSVIKTTIKRAKPVETGLVVSGRRTNNHVSTLTVSASRKVGPGDFNQAVDLLNEMLASLPSDRRDLTIAFCRKILVIAPENTVAWWHLLNALAEEQRGSELQQFANIATETFRSEPSFAYFLGWSYYLQKDLEQARQIFEKVVMMDPCYDPALYWLGEIAFLQGDVISSEQWLTRCIEVSPERSGYLSRLSIIVLLRGQLERAYELAEHAQLINLSGCKGTRRNMAEFFLYVGELDRVEEYLINESDDESLKILNQCWEEKQQKMYAIHAGETYQPLYRRLLPRA
jgi:tetratricopeptide (TPR) repeat protein